MTQPDDDLIDALYDVLARTTNRYLAERNAVKEAGEERDALVAEILKLEREIDSLRKTHNYGGKCDPI